MGTASLRSGTSGVGPRCGTEGSGQYKSPGMRHSVRDGLWRPGRAFFHIGLVCVMSHHHSPHRRALHILVLILAGKFKMEFLPTVSHWKGFPVAQICPNSHKIVSSYKGTLPVAQSCLNSHKIVSSSVRAFPVAEICPYLHKIISSHTESPKLA